MYDLKMTIPKLPSLSYIERLSTFHSVWDDSLEATTRQLAATGHVCDRPPLEALEDGSHCISCNKFVKRQHSVVALQNSLFHPSQDSSLYQGLKLHHAACIFLQNRIPLDAQSIESDLRGNNRLIAIRNFWEHRSKPHQRTQPIEHHQQQTSSLFSLPTELRLEIYSQILPVLPSTTCITTLNRQSIRLVTEDDRFFFLQTPGIRDTVPAISSPRPRDTTKINLLSTCHPVYEEALDILFANKTYRFDSTKILYLFLRHIGEHGRRLLKAVDVSCGQREDAIAFALLALCPKLKTITIRLERLLLLPPDAPLWVRDGVACLLELSGLERVMVGEDSLSRPRYLDESTADAAIVRRELTRPRGEGGGVRWVDGHLDL